MERRYCTQKYASLAISSALHGLIIALLLISWRQASTDSLIPLRNNPAEVQWYLPAGNSVPSGTTTPINSEATNKNRPISPPYEEFHQIVSEKPHSDSSLTSTPTNIEGIHSSQRTYSGDVVSPGTFMQAFKAAVKAEREGSYANEGSETSQIPIHVKERLDKWSQISYKQRIAEALLQADKRLGRSIVSHRAVRTRVHLILTINKNGLLGRVDYKKLSGMPDIDRYIKDLVSTITFAPIPDRLGISSFEFPVTIDVTLLEGTNRIRLYLV